VSPRDLLNSSELPGLTKGLFPFSFHFLEGRTS
jgi:hypothetical protein